MLVLKWGWLGPEGEAGGADCIPLLISLVCPPLCHLDHTQILVYQELSTNLRTSHQTKCML